MVGLPVPYNHLHNLLQDLSSANFHLPFSPTYLFIKSFLQFPPTLPSSNTQRFLSSLFLDTGIPTISCKIFSLPHPFSQFELHRETTEQRSLVRTDSDLISSWLSEVWTGITALTISNSLLLKFRKLVYCK